MESVEESVEEPVKEDADDFGDFDGFTAAPALLLLGLSFCFWSLWRSLWRSLADDFVCLTAAPPSAC